MNALRNQIAASASTFQQFPAPPSPQRNARFAPSESSVESTRTPPKTVTSSRSEHGHDLTKIQPLAVHSGNSVATFFNGLFKTIIALATLGTSITFSFVLSDQTTPPLEGARFDADAIQFFLSISWLLFLLTLAIASLGSTFLTFFRKHWVHDWDGEHGERSQLTVQLYAVSVSAITGGLIIAAFIFMCLVVVAYQPVVGWLSLGCTSFFGIIVVISICNQVPWPWVEARSPDQAVSSKDSLA